MGEYSKEDGVETHASILADIILRFINLLSEIKNNPSPDSNTILREVTLINADLQDWDERLPERWGFTTVETNDDSGFVFNKQTHRYRDMWIARIYNNYRWARILINELLIVHMAQLRPSSSECIDQQKRSLEIISKMALDICRSVPSQFSRHTAEEAKQNQVPNMAGCFLLLFPLAVAGSAIGVSEELHEWIITTLGTIGHKMGIAQALEMIPQTRRQRESWKAGYDMCDVSRKRIHGLTKGPMESC